MAVAVAEAEAEVKKKAWPVLHQIQLKALRLTKVTKPLVALARSRYLHLSAVPWASFGNAGQRYV